MSDPADFQITLQRYHADSVKKLPPVNRPYRDAQNRKRVQVIQRKPQVKPGRIEGYRFPVNPENIDIRFGRETSDVSLLRRGTVSRPGPNTPAEISFSSFLPDPAFLASSPSWMNVPLDELPDPWIAVRQLRTWQVTDEDPGSEPSPLKLTIADIGQVFWVVMTEFNVQTRPGPTDAYFDISFKEVAELPSLVMRRQKAKRTNPKPVAARVETKAGENLVAVVKRHYGKVTSAMVQQVYAANKAKIGPDKTKRLPEGTALVMPKLSTPGALGGSSS